MASEASSNDVTPCVAAIVDTESLPCVDYVYEPLTVDYVDCAENSNEALADSAPVEECSWGGVARST